LHPNRPQAYDPRNEQREAEANMERMISKMLTNYEQGKLNRR